MIKGHPQIVLYQPEIPQNTGNIGRLAAGSGCRLHLIEPFGFSAHDKNLRRAGLDYWPYLDLEIHSDIKDLLGRFKGRIAFFSKKVARPYWSMPPEVDLLVFGRETSGLPPWIMEEYADHMYCIPMFHNEVRSHNLGNAASIIVYHCLERRHNQ